MQLALVFADPSVPPDKFISKTSECRMRFWGNLSLAHQIFLEELWCQDEDEFRSEVCSDSSETPKMELFVKIVNGF